MFRVLAVKEPMLASNSHRRKLQKTIREADRLIGWHSGGKPKEQLDPAALDKVNKWRMRQAAAEVSLFKLQALARARKRVRRMA